MSERNHEVPVELERALAAEASLRSRMRYAAVGLSGGCGAALIAVLWATEPQPLPGRTQAAFATLIAVGLAWAGVAGWVLSRRRPLFARDRVLAARLALAVTTVTGTAATVLAAVRGTTAVTLATALLGAVLIAVAAIVLARASSRRRELLALRDALRRDPS
ncbi:transmembrane transport protein [Streptomyces sp. NPDC026673]|uniref:transmembrane transport protein n=1 Tax=Streptomyces sp. NPDC026673 TaxID=3155724 RepID=UPI0033C97071